jgi:rhodanese-related sulfurtransferase
MRPVSIDMFKDLEPLSALSPQSAVELASLCYTKQVGRSLNPLAEQDLKERTLYLLKGELRLVAADHSSELIVGGTDTARFSLSARSSRFISAKAVTNIELMCVDSNQLDVMFTWDQLAGRRNEKNAADPAPDWRTMSGIFAVENLTRGAFSALPPAHIDALFDRFDRIKVTMGQQIIREGDPGDYYYVVQSGRAIVTRRVGGTDVHVAELRPGAAFGEEALVANTNRNASVTMKTDGELLRVAKDDFIELLREPLLHQISMHDAEEKIERGAIWIDVRFPAEYQQDKLPGAINIPVNEIRNLFRGLDRNNEYIVYCQSGRRSSAAAFLLAQYGFKAHVLEGGLWTSVPSSWLDADTDLEL